MFQDNRLISLGKLQVLIIYLNQHNNITRWLNTKLGALFDYLNKNLQIRLVIRCIQGSSVRPWGTFVKSSAHPYTSGVNKVHEKRTLRS